MKNANFSTYVLNENKDSCWGIDIHNFGKQEISEAYNYPPKNHPSGHYYRWEKGRILREYQIIYIESGSGEVEFEESKNIFSAPFLIFLGPNQWHRYRPQKDSGWHEYWIGFTGYLIENLKDAQKIPLQNQVIPLKVGNPMGPYFHEIEKVYSQNSENYDNKLISIMHQILVQISSITSRLSDQPTDKEGLWADKIKKDITFLANNQINWQELAMKSGMSYSLFRKKFKELTKYSPKQYQLEIRFRNACDLLDNSDMSILEIAQQLGFDNQFHFSNHFKKRYGVSPLKWRKQLVT